MHWLSGNLVWSGGDRQLRLCRRRPGDCNTAPGERSGLNHARSMLMNPSIADSARPSSVAPEIPGSLPERQGQTRFVHRRVGVVELGHMGQAFAANLIADGHQVFVWDRNPERMHVLQRSGAHAAVRLADLSHYDAVISSVSDDDALAAVALGAEGLVSVLAAQTVHISMSTVSPALSGRLVEKHALHGQAYVAAPGLGNPDAAQARKLFVLAAGRAAAVEKVRPLLEGFGQRLFVIAENAAAGESCQARWQRAYRDCAREHG